MDEWFRGLRCRASLGDATVSDASPFNSSPPLASVAPLTPPNNYRWKPQQHGSARLSSDYPSRPLCSGPVLHREDHPQTLCGGRSRTGAGPCSRSTLAVRFAHQRSELPLDRLQRSRSQALSCDLPPAGPCSRSVLQCEDSSRGFRGGWIQLVWRTILR